MFTVTLLSDFDPNFTMFSYTVNAHDIISIQSQIQVRCAICGSLFIRETQLFNTGNVLFVDLLFSSKYKDANISNA